MTRLRQVAVILALVAAAWAAALLLTHGIAMRVGPFVIRSRTPKNPALLALIFLGLAVIVAPPGARWRTVAGDLAGGLTRLVGLASGPRGTTLMAAALTIAPLVISAMFAVFVAGGSDSYGYISEAHLFATGHVRAEQPLLHRFEHIPPLAFVRLGYHLSADGQALAPIYSPGVPLAMAVAELIGGPGAVYVVMPLLAVLAVWSTYRLGQLLVAPAVGLGAAALVLFSPAFLFQLTGAPMSDIAAAGWWALSLVMLLAPRGSAVVAGCAAGMAILTRPNLVPLAAILALFTVWQVRRDGASWARTAGRFVRFSGPVVLACLAVAGLNTVWNGSPLRSGYDPTLFNVGYADDNLVHYPAWLTETQTPIFLLGFAAPLLMPLLGRDTLAWRRPVTWLLVVFAATVFAGYLFYMPFDAWWYLRFLLPAYPALAVLTCAALAALLSSRAPAARAAMATTVIAAVTVYGLYFAYRHSVFQPGIENRYRLLGEYVATRLPGNAAIFSMQHSGSLRHYSGRETVRYDVIAPTELDAALAELTAAGYHPYLALDGWEVTQFRERFNGRSTKARLDWPPLADLPLGPVSLWDLAVDPAAAAAANRLPDTIAMR